jgi:hypothetical protein
VSLHPESAESFIRRDALACRFGILNPARRRIDQSPDGKIQPARRDPMSTRSSILALAVAAISVAALAPTSASAKLPMGVIVEKPHPIMGVVVKPHPIMGVPVHPNPIMGVVVHPPGLIAHPPGLVVNPPGANPPHPIMGVVVHPPHPIMGVVVHPDPDPDPPHIWWHHHHAPVLFEDGDTTRASAPVATVPSGPCTCLTKKYLEDGSVLFKDVCTKEAALAAPDELKAQTQGAGR